ncbi:MAG TPA: DEAD/DEAH box helicase [Pseudonocardia sp.]|nr:DEAD/DEAH box helicase [Pseudonocardia sp.]
MQLITIDGLDPASVEAVVDARTYARGLTYARDRRVLHMSWDEAEEAVRAVVRGNDGSAYETAVYLHAGHGDAVEFTFGECSCPVGVDCKHAVAVAVAACAGSVGSNGRRANSSPEWARTLDELLAPVGPAQPIGAVPLAVELSLQLPPVAAALRGVLPARARLLARLVKPGRTGWVGGGLTWNKLESHYALPDCRPTHVDLLRELLLMYQARTPTGYRPREDRTIDLAVLGDRLWSVLDEMADAGLELVHARRALGPVARYGHAELNLDVTAGPTPGSLVVAPQLHLTGPDMPGQAVAAVAFLGADGHGVLHVPPGHATGDPGGWPFQLARLAAPAPPALQRLVLSRERIPVPAGQQAHFAERFWPGLRHLARIESSDGAFTPPTISAPTLVLRVAHGVAHEAALTWEWAYEVGDRPVRAQLGPSTAAEGVRDRAAERQILTALAGELAELGLPADGPAPITRLHGMDTVRLHTELLPLLADRPGLIIEQTGEPVTYREAGDSLQIAVSTDPVAGDRDWFDLGVRISVEGRQVPFATVFTALAAGETHLLLADGAYFSLQKPELQTLRTLIEEARALRDAPPGELRISRFQAGLWAELAELGVVDRQARAWQEQVAGLLALDGMCAPGLPAAVRAELRPYQRDGYEWLCFLFRNQLGGILADDMGLGKTLQTLAMICLAKQERPGMDPFLIVAPTSVLANWAAEAARFTPDLRVVTITDTLRRRGQDLAEVIAGADVVVTSYTLFRLDADAHAAAEWSGLILDEAQFAKNHQSKVYQCARRLPAPFKLAITGTPMENNLMELWSMLSITAPGLFPNPTRFREHFAQPIEKQSDVELLTRLRRRIKPLVKRRTKEQVAADLPAKQEQVLDVELDTKHRRIYQRHLQRERQKVLGLLHDVDRNRFTILRSLTLLRQLSLHPALIEPEHAELSCAKIDTLLEQLGEVVDGGHRALVFSQFTGFLAQVRERLEAAGVPYSYLDGGTRNRATVVDEFKRGAAPVFLISLKAGGFGLNLTEADYCFLLDPWWNPAAEAQAVDRTHRIGQTRGVMVYRMIAKDTIEEKVLALARRKAELCASVLDEGGVFGSTLDAADIRELLS